MPNNNSYFFIKSQSIKYAKDEKMCKEVLIGLLLTYLNFYSNFINKNINQIQKYLKKENNQLTELEKENLNKLTTFLDSGRNLINKETKEINQNEFDKYISLTTKNDSNKWNEFVKYAENELKLKNISNLNYNLQFIVGFYKDQNVKEVYFYKVLSQIWEKENKTENLFKKIFEDEEFRPELNRNVQLEQTKTDF